MKAGRFSGRVAFVALAIALLAASAAVAAGRVGGTGRTFGVHGVATDSLPDALASSHFSLVVSASAGRSLVVDTYESDRSEYHAEIERFLPDGSPDPTFGDAGSVGLAGQVEVLAEDPAGGVVYSGDGGLGRLEPDGAPDLEFDHHARYNYAAGIAFDSQGRILAVRTNPLGPRYHPHAGELEVLRFEPNGEPDLTFGTKGVVYLGSGVESGDEVGLLADGSIVATGAHGLDHVAADGTVLPSLMESNPGESIASLASYPDGGFAVASTMAGESGCRITRYLPDGSPDQAFGARTAFADKQTGCALAVTSEGDLLVREALGYGQRKGQERLLLLTADGEPAAGFGEAGTVTLNAPGQAPGAGAATIEDAVPVAEGRILVSAGEEDATLMLLGPNGEIDPSFGQNGTIVQHASLPSWTKAHSIAAEPDGGLIVTGITDSESREGRPFLMRLTADGKVAPLRSGRLFAAVPFLATDLRPVGSRYLYGLVHEGKGPTYLAKLETDGSPVEGFGHKGLLRLPRGFRSRSLVVDPDGGVTAVGSLDQARMAAYRVTASGKPVPSFGDHGLAVLRLRGASGSQADSGTLLPGGRLVLGGLVDEHLAVAEMGPDGLLRKEFGSGGVSSCGCGGARPYRVEVVAHRGHLYVLDHWKGPIVGEGDTLVKLTEAGRVDRGFAGVGHRLVKIGLPVALFVHGDRIAVAGQKTQSAGPVQVREFDLDGAFVHSSDGGGRDIVGGGRAFERRLSAALQPDGRVVFAGEPRSRKEFGGSALQLVGLN